MIDVPGAQLAARGAVHRARARGRATKVFHEGKTGTSVLVTAQGVGAVADGADPRQASPTRFGHRRVLLGALTTLPFALVLYALAPIARARGRRDLRRRLPLPRLPVELHDDRAAARARGAPRAGHERAHGAPRHALPARCASSRERSPTQIGLRGDDRGAAPRHAGLALVAIRTAATRLRPRPRRRRATPAPVTDRRAPSSRPGAARP